jgi:hypothetical protein
MAREQPDDKGEGIKNPKTFDTVEEAMAHRQKVAEIEESLLAMTPADRAEWFALNGDENGSVNIDELE